MSEEKNIPIVKEGTDINYMALYICVVAPVPVSVRKAFDALNINKSFVLDIISSEKGRSDDRSDTSAVS